MAAQESYWEARGGGGGTFGSPVGVAHTCPMQPGQALIALQPQARVLLRCRAVFCHSTHTVNTLLPFPLLPHLLPLHRPLARFHTQHAYNTKTFSQEMYAPSMRARIKSYIEDAPQANCHIASAAHWAGRLLALSQLVRRV